MPGTTTSTARTVREYLDAHPALADAIRLNVGNYSAIARRISTDLGIRGHDAVLAACRRYPKGRTELTGGTAARRVLRNSRVETRTKVAAVTISQGSDTLGRVADVVEELLDENSLCRLIQVSQGTVIIVDESSVPRLTKVIRSDQLVGTRKGLVEVSVTSPESIEQTPGLLNLLTGVLSTRGINIVEALSCYTDTIFLLAHDDLSPAVEVLSRVLE